MLTFKEYLNEVITRDDLNIKRSKKAVISTFNGMEVGKTFKEKGRQKLYTVNDVTVYKEVTPHDMSIICVDESGKVVMQLILVKKNAMYYVDAAVSTSKTYKAYELYRDLLVKNIVPGLISAEQSAGGRSIWDKLSKFRNIEVYGWDPYHNTPINLGNSLPDEVETHVSLYNTNKDKDTNQTRRMLLVAVKKT